MSIYNKYIYYGIYYIYIYIGYITCSYKNMHWMMEVGALEGGAHAILLLPINHPSLPRVGAEPSDKSTNCYPEE